MNVKETLSRTKLASAAPIMEFLENDQVLPAGMWRWRIQGDAAILERATATDWSTVTAALTVTSGGAVTPISFTVSDDQPLTFGGVVSFLWETVDANANAFLIQLPTGGAVDVPVIVIGQGVTNVDLGLYTGVVDPRIAMFGVGAVTTAPVWEFRKARGTVAAPTAITSGDDVGSLNAYVCVANGEWKQSAAILFDSEGTIATTRGPGAISFQTSTDAAPGVLTEGLRISSAQKLLIKGNVWLDADPSVLYVRNSGDTAGGALNAATLAIQTSLAGNDGFAFNTVDSDAGYAVFKARDTGVALVEIARMVGAADPYIQIGRDDTGVALNAITDGVVFQMGGGTGNEAAGFGFGMSFKIGNAASEVEERGSIDLRLVTATNGAEDTGWDISTMLAGVMNLAFRVDQAGELYGDADSSSGAYMTQNVNLFDAYDDALELRRFQLTVPRTGLISEEQRLENRRRMVELGVFEENPRAHSGYMMRMQQMTRLLAGGIWQTRQALENLRDEVLARLKALEARTEENDYGLK